MTGPGSGLDKLPEGADPRGAIAIARTNWLHSKYPIVSHLKLWHHKVNIFQLNKQSNDDFLYTLALFIIEPAVWMEKYEWRGLTPLERQVGSQLFVR